MPVRSRRKCTASGCPEWATDDGRCPRHHIPRPKPKPKQRPTRQQLGYNEDWLHKSAKYRRQHRQCEAPTCISRSQHTDHIDGDRTNWEDDNLQALCRTHHSRKTAQHDGGYGNPKTTR